MKRVLYNADYGGFGISTKATQWICDKLGVAVEFKDGSCGYPEMNDEDRTLYSNNIKRHSQLMLDCFDELGSKVFSGRCAAVRDFMLEGNQYDIEDYDGSETVIQPSDTQYWTTID